MGMFDYVSVDNEIDLKGFLGDRKDLQTKDFECLLDVYEINAAGRLIRKTNGMEVVPEEERPNYGTPKWDKPLGSLIGSLRSVPSCIDTNYHGIVRAIGECGDGKWADFAFKFTDGTLVEVTLQVSK